MCYLISALKRTLNAVFIVDERLSELSLLPELVVVECVVHFVSMCE